MRGRATDLLLLSAIAALTPLAYASPPDPTWFAGLWDDADFDDVVLAVVSAVGALEAARPELPGWPTAVAALLYPAEARETGRAGFEAFSVRAPPLA
jgi:hypothetical protein